MKIVSFIFAMLILVSCHNNYLIGWEVNSEGDLEQVFKPKKFSEIDIEVIELNGGWGSEGGMLYLYVCKNVNHLSGNRIPELFCLSVKDQDGGESFGENKNHKIQLYKEGGWILYEDNSKYKKLRIFRIYNV